MQRPFTNGVAYRVQPICLLSVPPGNGSSQRKESIAVSQQQKPVCKFLQINFSPGENFYDHSTISKYYFEYVL